MAFWQQLCGFLPKVPPRALEDVRLAHIQHYQEPPDEGIVVGETVTSYSIVAASGLASANAKTVQEQHISASLI